MDRGETAMTLVEKCPNKRLGAEVLRLLRGAAGKL
jgi:hypothetical protein